MMLVEKFKIENETEAENYLQDLLKQPENRSMEQVHIRAADHIPDIYIRRFFIKRAEQLLKVSSAS